MKKSIFAVILYSLMAFPGCQVVGIDSIEDNPSAGDKTVTITANIAGSTDTKVSLTPGTDNNGNPIIKVDWKPSGEKFYVIGASEIAEFTQVSDNLFEGVLPEAYSNGYYVALYGSEELLFSSDYLEAYCVQDGTLDEKYVQMEAVFDAQSESITFDHETSIFKLAFKYNDEPLTNITSVTVGDKSKGTHEISITPPEGKEALNDDIYMHVAFSINVFANDQMMFKVMAGDKEYEASLTIPSDVDLELGKLYTATINLEEKYNGVDLSKNGTANSYIISAAGSYKFSTVKGNSSTSVGAVNYAEVLWESFGTATAPAVGDLVNNVSYSDGYISFTATEAEGNAVIAAKSDNGTPDDTSDDVILWSWHIWLTDEPQGQEYNNNAGTMMDRNLGATSATPGDVGALGLLYQWGRKDPFLGSSSISSSTIAKSTIKWPDVVLSTLSEGTIAYATANPTTFIRYNYIGNKDWYYTGSDITDNTRWTTSTTTKSIYDPCPAGWRVPDGGSNGVWAKALASSGDFYYTYDGKNEGINLSNMFGSDQTITIWYPTSGYRDYADGSLKGVGSGGYYWSASPNDIPAYDLYLSDYNPPTGLVRPSTHSFRAHGQSVRCLQE